ncbi:leucyl aminopeptidase [Allobacillus sp. SKP2-8]|uniref:leucyl aminopeptidase n=1 Tax=unclassified Allobacillus TaxID=2628859 RepID=UPI00118428F0|nr:leucyl aminopeptidase [Allobacillus sp. SKP2-8]TSJ61931.1 leucyl aminopeptidase [Allobacillus sp. SKP2-8]
MFQQTQDDVTKASTKALIVGLFEEQKNNQTTYEELNQVFDQQLDELMQAGDLSNQYGKLGKIHTLGKIEAERLYFVGLGKREELTTNRLRKAVGKAFQSIQKDGVDQAAISVASILQDNPTEEQLEAIGDAFALSTFEQSTCHTNRPEKTNLGSLNLISKQELDLSVVEKGYAYGTGANTARYLVNLPSNLLTATDLANFAENIANENDLEIEVLGKEEIEELGMGALLAVNQGSDEPPRFIVMKYQGKDTWENPTALVGKGITFDTGGYSLKPKDGIVGMKMDMGGAAAVVGAMEIIGKTKPKENVMGIIAATDNMISGKAFKPDDVIVSMSGKTIEIRNTDAEGRLALADAVAYARKEGAAKIVDIATLTGGVIVALGDKVTGALTNNDEWYEEIKTASEKMDEPVWAFPYMDHFREEVRTSHIADLNNSPGRKAQSILAAAFVGEFAEDTPWVHLDIAGTAVSDSAYDLGPKGSTGVMARTLAKAVHLGE